MENKRIILASQSPRRKELLTLLGLKFEIIVADIVETIDYNNDLVKEIEKLSYLKAKKVFDGNTDSLVIGADTIVKIDNKVLGKPKSIEDAKNMLRMLSGRTHEVVTGTTIITSQKTETFSSIAKVTFYELSQEEIDAYIKTNEPMDKAGAYAIQGDGAKLVKSIEGDFYTIVGLPIGEINQRLKNFD